MPVKASFSFFRSIYYRKNNNDLTVQIKLVYL